MTLWVRVVGGALSGASISLMALRGGLLTPAGGAAAVLVGTTSVASGWAWGMLLVFFFLTSSALTRWRDGDKREATRDILEPRTARDAWQVLVNGGVFAGAGVMGLISGSRTWWTFGLGALSTSTADTWATEVGTALGGAPRHLLTGRSVPPGTSGGVTLPGTLASLAGAVATGAVAISLGFAPRDGVAAAVGGFTGALADTLLGATVQERRCCPACGLRTERREHGCGTPTHRVGGIAGVTNDVVNLASTLAGGGVAAWLGRGGGWW